MWCSTLVLVSKAFLVSNVFAPLLQVKLKKMAKWDQKIIIWYIFFGLIVTLLLIMFFSRPLVPTVQSYASQGHVHQRASQIPGVDSSAGVKIINTNIFDYLLTGAKLHPRKRKMSDMTRNANHNSMQTLINTWTNDSYSPVHKHNEYSEAFVILEGALAFFTFTNDGEVACNIISSLSNSKMIAEKRSDEWHAMAAAPASLGWPGHAIVFETSGHKFDTSHPTKVLAPFAPQFEDNMNGNPEYFLELFKHCPRSHAEVAGGVM